MERRNRIRRRRPRTKRIPCWSGFTRFGCHSAFYPRESERERERENTSQPDNKEKIRKEKI